jgi:hypothetical protein
MTGFHTLWCRRDPGTLLRIPPSAVALMSLSGAERSIPGSGDDRNADVGVITHSPPRHSELRAGKVVGGVQALGRLIVIVAT